MPALRLHGYGSPEASLRDAPPGGGERLGAALRRSVAALLLVLASGLAHGAHPLISEDTGTQGTGKFELELGTVTSHPQGDRTHELDPQLSFGARDDLDLILRPSYFWLTGDTAQSAGRRHGFGTTALDFKWRPIARGPWSFGMRGGFDLPTSQGDIAEHELGSHALVMATYFAEPLMATINVSYTHLPHDAGVGVRRDGVRVSAGGHYSVSDALRLAADLATSQSTEAGAHGWPTVGVIGLILTLPWGFDVDAGVQFPINRSAPSTQWLVGATVRW